MVEISTRPKLLLWKIDHHAMALVGNDDPSNLADIKAD